jgi:Fe-S oxidoreductase
MRLLMFEDHRKETETCRYCPDLCLDRCPVLAAEGNLAYSPFGKMSIVNMLSSKALKLDSSSGRALYKCTGCLACFEWCRHHIEVSEVLFKCRAEAVKQGFSAADFKLLQADEEKTAYLLKKILPQKYFCEEAKVLFYPGVDAITESPAIIRDSFRMFEKLDLQYIGVTSASHVWDGYSSYAAGYIDKFREIAERNAKIFRKYRAIITISACSAYTLKVLYPNSGIDGIPQVKLIHEIAYPIIEKISQTKAKKTGGGFPSGIVYHDSCFMSRHLKCLDEPRQIIRLVAGEMPLEMRRNRELSQCCGAGGVYNITSPEGAEKSARNVLQMAKETGAELLLNCCANCVSHLKKFADEEIKVQNLISFLAGRL